MPTIPRSRCIIFLISRASVGTEPELVAISTIEMHPAADSSAFRGAQECNADGCREVSIRSSLAALLTLCARSPQPLAKSPLPPRATLLCHTFSEKDLQKRLIRNVPLVRKRLQLRQKSCRQAKRDCLRGKLEVWKYSFGRLREVGELSDIVSFPEGALLGFRAKSRNWLKTSRPGHMRSFPLELMHKPPSHFLPCASTCSPATPVNSMQSSE